MLSTQIFESLECALSTHLKHISINPISLSCGHSICKKCKPKDTNASITCVHCKKMQVVPNNQDKSLSAKSLFNVFIDKMFEYVEDKFKCSLGTFSGKYSDNTHSKVFSFKV
jgi:hypothetical protein